MTITVTSHLSSATTPLEHVRKHTVGSSRADWQEQHRRCHDDLGFRHVRFRALFTDDMGALIAHHEKPLCSFFRADRTVRFDVALPPHAVAAVTLELAPEPSDRGAAARAASRR